MRSLIRLLAHTRAWRAVPLAVLATALVAVASPGQAQTGTVQGQVTTSSTGRPIDGARVSVVGTSIGTITDADGMYVLLNVPTGSRQLQVSAIGFSMGTISLDVTTGTTTANAEVTASVLRLDEVVVTGTAGQARRREVGNSIAQIDVSQIAAPPQNVENLLQGRAAGVNITTGSGMAGSGSQIRLRGAVSVSQTNQPLIYIDGVRVENQGYLKNVPPVGYNGRSGNVSASPLNDINPNDIDRIEVIKGAAASTLYGTDASAGVIQIFTKRGTQGAPRWELQVDQGMTVLRPFGTENNPYLNMKPCDGDLSITCSELWDSNEVVGTCDQENPDPQCAWVRNGYRQKYAGSVRGGVGSVGYFVSGSFEDYDNVLLQDNERRLSTRGNFNFDIFDNVRIDWNTAYTNNRIQNTASGNNAHGITLNVFRAERNYVQSLEPELLAPLLNQEITTEIDRLITGGTVTYTPWPDFTNRFTIGYDLANQENRNVRPPGFVSAPGGILSDQQVRFQTLTADYAGSIGFNLADEIRSTFSFGGQSVSRELISTIAYGEDFAPGVPTVSNGALYVARESRERTVTAGFFLQNLFALKDRYFLTGGIRFDGNSAFGSSLGLEAYPKAQGSWVISDESFWPENLISEMKLRAALGMAGRAPGAFDAVRTWENQPSNFEPALLPANVGNDSIGPERTREIELGFDAGFLSNRVSAEFTWYHQRTTDALFGVRNVPSLGFEGSQLANVGTIQNKGIELAVNAIVIDAPDWGLDLGLNLYTNHSLVVDLGEAVPFAAGGGWVEEGYPVMAARGIKLSDPNALEDPVECAADGSNAGACNFTRDQIFGPQQPTEVFTGNVMVRLPKGIRVSARGEFQAGHYIYDGPTGNALSRSVRWPTCEAAYQLIDDGQEADLNLRQRMECIPANHEFDMHWYKADFFKLRDITLSIPMGWAIPRSNSATLALSAQNYFKWVNSDLRVFDPEMFGNGGTERSGLDDQNAAITEHVPSPAVLTASLRISF